MLVKQGRHLFCPIQHSC